MGLAILLALIAYIVLARFIVRYVEKRTGSRKAKYLAMAVFVLIPTWDIVPGWLYFAYVCREGGQKIYKTVELGPQYILQPGQPDRSKNNVPLAMGGEIDWAKLKEERYANPTERDENFSAIIHIVKHSSSIRDKQTGEELGSATTFIYYGGWLVNSEPRQSWECPSSPINEDYVHSSLPKKIFRQEPSVP